MNLQRGEESGLRLVVMIISCKDRCRLCAAQAESRYWGKLSRIETSELAGEGGRRGRMRGMIKDTGEGRRGRCGGCGGCPTGRSAPLRFLLLVDRGSACCKKSQMVEFPSNRSNLVLRVNSSVDDDGWLPMDWCCVVVVVDNVEKDRWINKWSGTPRREMTDTSKNSLFMSNPCWLFSRLEPISLKRLYRLQWIALQSLGSGQTSHLIEY
ncbi:hypothetical protein QBC43DRAFT_90889 [Cladorrhinum sp. PSN259]|nr:hypothetical protein QBC43DRAFT_90889 [Cladorrhinum sp. PSN259]